MIQYRPANFDDAGFLYRLRNDPDTLSNSHNTDPVSWDDHIRWVTWNFKDQFVRIYIGFIGDQNIGVLRISEESTGKLFSWTIAPECRGKGYGKALVKALVDTTEGRLKAEIKAGNEPSKHIAEHAGFILEYEKNGICYYAIIPDGYIHDPLSVMRHM